MARLLVRSGINPDDPDAPVVVLLVDPDGPPGERAVARLGAHGHEESGAFHLLPTDGWAERSLDGDRLTLAVAAYPVALRQVGVDPAAFPERSAAAPEAALLLRAEAVVDPGLYARADDVTAVFTAGPDLAPDEVPADEEPPLLLAPEPVEAEAGEGPGTGT
ncbi:hypothetical protein ACFCX4_19100 [Kitasatospora sp. NPDC056327]|uniref:hypothetical protein n=1 Tax=Kitasatospora sp. NPDC056327 TaxID=3345785 RepID=UPI0035DBBB6D